jgi:hypothetical protein
VASPKPKKAIKNVRGLDFAWRKVVINARVTRKDDATARKHIETVPEFIDECSILAHKRPVFAGWPEIGSETYTLEIA